MSTTRCVKNRDLVTPNIVDHCYFRRRENKSCYVCAIVNTVIFLATLSQELQKMKGKIAIWAMLFFIVDAEMKCEFEPDGGMMFHACNATDGDDNILRRGLVSDKRKTFHLILKECNIVSIEQEAFYRLPALVILDLAENKIKSLPSGVFDRLPLLSQLNLSYNLLSEIPQGMFNHNTDLSVLDLEGNKLHTLKPGLFDSLRRLYQLDLSHNFFTGKEIVSELFDKKRDISILTLSGNDMTEANFLSIMNNLNYLFLDGCSLKEVPKLATAANMKHIRHLSLSSNEITTVDDATTFSNLIDVMKLNLSRNQISFVHKDAFKNLRYLEEIDLRYNKLTTLPVEMFQNIRKLYELRISYNLLTDIPLNAFAGTELKRLSFDHNNITHLHKHFLLKIEDAGLMLSLMHFGTNPWQCACLIELLKEAKEMEVLYDTDTYDGQHPVCVSTRNFYCRRDEAAHDEFIRMYNENIR